MATQSVEFSAAPGQTLTVRLFSAGSDTIVATAGTVTAATNRAGIYTAAFTDVAAGRYRLIATNAAGTPLATWWTDLTLTTATFQTYEMPMSLVQTIGQSSIDQIGSDFLAHVLTKGSPGTIENTLWKISKTNASAEGEVDDATPTASEFTTNLTGVADEYNGQVLVFTSGTLTGEARPIDDCTESGGVLTLTMQRAFTSAPADEDEFLILPQQVYSIAAIQAGLATLANQTTIIARLGAFTGTGVNTVLGFLRSMASKAASTPSDIGGTYTATTDSLEAIRDAQMAGTGDASQATLEAVQDTVDAIAAKVSGGLIEVTSRVATGGNITLYIGDDARVRSGTEIEVTISDVGGTIYSRLDSLGIANLAWGASRRGLGAGAISGTISGLSQSGSGATQAATFVVEIDDAGDDLLPHDDYTWQIMSTSASGDEWVEVEGTLDLRRRVAVPI